MKHHTFNSHFIVYYEVNPHYCFQLTIFLLLNVFSDIRMKLQSFVAPNCILSPSVFLN